MGDETPNRGGGEALSRPPTLTDLARLCAELNRLVPVPAGPNWGEVLQLAGHANQHWRHRTRLAAIIAAVAGAATVLALATPLGAGSRSLNDCST